MGAVLSLVRQRTSGWFPLFSVAWLLPTFYTTYFQWRENTSYPFLSSPATPMSVGYWRGAIP